MHKPQPARHAFAIPAAFKATLLAALLTFAAGVGEAHAAKVIQLSIDTAGVDRSHTPMYANLEVNHQVTAAEVAELGKTSTVLVKVGNKRVAGELRRVEEDGKVKALKVLWIQPAGAGKGKIDASITLSKSSASETGFRFVDADGGRDLFHGQRPVYRHVNLKHDEKNHHDTYKHFHHLYGMHKDGLITKGPGGKYTHHRGMYIGWSKTKINGKSYDFWHCRTPKTFIQHVGYQDEALGSVVGKTSSVAEWRQGDEVMIKETRTVTAWAQPAGRTLLDLTFKLEAIAGDAELNGDPQHAGFQIRAHEGVQSSHAKYTRPKDVTGGKGDVWSNLRWCVAHFAKVSHNYSIMHINHPDNPQCVYSTRNYGRFGSYFKAPLKKGEPMTLKFRVIVFDADKHKPDYASEYEAYVKPVKVSAK